MMLLDLNSWWQGLLPFDKTLWIIAILFSTLFLIQTVLSLVGGDTDTALGDADHYVGGDDGIGHQFFTIKNMIAFFTVFGWAGIASSQNGMSKGVTIALALGAGIAMVAMMVLLLKGATKMKHSGTLNMKNALNKTGEVYLPIPGNKAGIGKIQLMVQGSLRELDAITADPASIPTGKLVHVKEIVNDQILLVSINP